MSRHRLKFTTLGGHLEKVWLDDADISGAVRGLEINAQPGQIPVGHLEILALDGMEVDAAIAELSMIDTREVMNLRSYLGEACDLCERLLSLMTDAQIAEVLKTRDTSRQIRLWKVHADGPDRDTSLRVYREKVRRVNADPAGHLDTDDGEGV